MKISFENAFIGSLNRQVEYISKGKPGAARKFKNEILRECKSLIDNPYRCRKSVHYNDENIRDLIFAGYTIIYEVSVETISVFALTKYENYQSDEIDIAKND